MTLAHQRLVKEAAFSIGNEIKAAVMYLAKLTAIGEAN